MTIICALRSNGDTWIGSDTQSTTSSERQQPQTPKWIIWDGFALGVCGTLAFLCLFQEHVKEIQPDWSGVKLWRWAMDHLIAFGVEPEKKPGYSPWVDCSLIFATTGRVVSVCPAGGALDYSAGEFCARGTGDEYALGAAYAMGSHTTKPEEIMTTAIEAAMLYDTSCGGKVWVRKL